MSQDSDDRRPRCFHWDTAEGVTPATMAARPSDIPSSATDSIIWAWTFSSSRGGRPLPSSRFPWRLDTPPRRCGLGLGLSAFGASGWGGGRLGAGGADFRPGPFGVFWKESTGFGTGGRLASALGVFRPVMAPSRDRGRVRPGKVGSPCKGRNRLSGWSSSRYGFGICRPPVAIGFFHRSNRWRAGAGVGIPYLQFITFCSCKRGFIRRPWA